MGSYYTLLVLKYSSDNVITVVFMMRYAHHYSCVGIWVYYRQVQHQQHNKYMRDQLLFAVLVCCLFTYYIII